MFDDLKLLDVSDCEKMPIRHRATGEVIKDKKGNEAWILVHPKDSKEGRIAERKILDARIKLKNKPITTASIEDEVVALFSALTVDWYLVKGNGEPAEYPCDEETKRQFYSDDSLRWIRDQVDSFVVDISNFFKG